jgi:hypothetical protein
MATMNLWQTIEAVTKQMPFSKEKMEALLSTSLFETDYTGNDVFRFYESNRVELTERVAISKVDLRIKRTGDHPGFMVLNIEGTCISLDEVRRHYGKMTITDHPRGRSPDEVTSHSAILDWGKLSFSFKERNPDCLSSIAFDPKK